MEWVVLITVIVALLTVDLVLHRGNHEPTAKRALVESAAWVACGLGFAVVVLVCDGRPRLRRVPQRLRDREVAQHRQRVRVGDHLLHFADPRALPAPRAVLGHLRCARRCAPSSSSPAPRSSSEFWWMLLVFGVVLLYLGVQGPAPRASTKATHGHDRAVKLLGRFMPVRTELAGQQLPRPRSGPRNRLGRDAAARGARRDRGDRRRVRGRQRAGHPRGVARAVHRVRVERVRDPRTAGDVLPARRRP